MVEFQEKCTVTAIEQTAVDVYRIALHAPLIAAAAQPGQFVMVRVADRYDPLLRRPFSIYHTSSNDTIELLFKKLGKGTGLLANAAKGDFFDLVGPLGHGFNLSTDAPVCMTGGGMGIAPLYFLAKQFQATGRDTQKDYVLLGARNRDEITRLADDFLALGYTVKTATDDGTMGHHGFIPDLLDGVLPEVSMVYTCGPHPMMKNIVKKCHTAEIACQVSLETHMACGLGACLGCTVAGAGGDYLHVCKQGPVFKSGEVAW